MMGNIDDELECFLASLIQRKNNNNSVILLKDELSSVKYLLDQLVKEKFIQFQYDVSDGHISYLIRSEALKSEELGGRKKYLNYISSLSESKPTFHIENLKKSQVKITTGYDSSSNSSHVVTSPPSKDTSTIKNISIGLIVTVLGGLILYCILHE